MTILLGCIADDFTGATDLANNLVRAGMRVVQTIGIPTQPIEGDFDAVVVALKSRTVSPNIAVKESLAALEWLKNQEAQQIYFKYCSTFDSWYRGEVRGNIGPVTESLMDALQANFTIATPAFPDNQRTVFNGHLFVGQQLLSASGMRNHPLTPMEDSNLVAVMQAQCRRKVGLIDYKTVNKGVEAIRVCIEKLRHDGVGIAIVDAITNDDLKVIASASSHLKLLTAGSGLAIGLPLNWGLTENQNAQNLPMCNGRQAIVSGSCSEATLLQVANFIAAGLPAWELDPGRMKQLPMEVLVDEALSFAQANSEHPVLIYSSAQPDKVKALQHELGTERASHFVEQMLALIAKGLVQQGVGQLVVAGGETSGACVQSLQIEQMQIGFQIAPGVPWCYAQSATAQGGIHLALKSGNFGGFDFFTQSFASLQGRPSL
jgi:uncharacterized protein YgbK (DUF1537 family)